MEKAIQEKNIAYLKTVPGEVFNKKIDGQPLLLIGAVMDGNLDVINVLLQQGADVNKCEPNGVTALHMAAMNSNSKLVEALLKEGADPTATDAEKWPPLWWAVSESSNEDVVKVLLQHEKNPSLSSQDQKELFSCAISREKLQGKDRVAAVLADHYQIDPMGKDNGGQLLWHRAVREGMEHLVEVFLKTGVDIDIRDAQGDDALRIAATKGHADVIDVIMKHKKELPEPERKKLLFELLTIALLAGNLDCVARFQLIGASFDKNETLFDLFAAAGTLHQVAAEGDPKAAEYLLEHGFDFYAPDENGQTPLDIAIMKGSGKVLNVFLDRMGPLGHKESKELLDAVTHFGHIVDTLQCHKNIKLEPEDIKAAFARIEKNIAEKKEKKEIKWSMLSRRQGVYIDASGKEKGFILDYKKDDHYSWLASGEPVFIMSTSRRPKKDKGGQSGNYSTLGWHSSAMFEGSGFGHHSTGYKPIGNFYERSEVPVELEDVPGTDGKFRAPAQSVDRFEGVEPREAVIEKEKATDETSFIYELEFGPGNKLIASRPVSPAGSRTEILRLKTKKSGPFRTEADKRIFGNLSAIAKKDLKKIEKATLEAHGRVSSDKPVVSIYDFPEKVVISSVGKFGRMITGGQAISKRPYLSMQWKRGKVWVKRSPDAKECGDWKELTGEDEVGKFPNPEMGKISSNDKSVATSTDLVIPGLLGSEFQDDVMGLMIRAAITGELFLTWLRDGLYTLADMAIVLRQWKEQGLFNIKELAWYACQAASNEVLDHIENDRIKNYKEKFWRQLFAKGVFLPTLSPNEIYEDADFIVTEFPFEKPPLIAKGTSESYSVANNPSIDDADAEWELVYPNGSFHAGSEDNEREAEQLYRDHKGGEWQKFFGLDI